MTGSVGDSSLFKGRQEYVSFDFLNLTFKNMYVRTLVKQFGSFFLLFLSHKVQSILFFF